LRCELLQQHELLSSTIRTRLCKSCSSAVLPPHRAGSFYRTNNALPIAVDDTYTVAAGGSVTMDLLLNYFDPDGDELQLTVHMLPRYGRLVRTQPGGGVFVYTPSPGIGSINDSFRYAYVRICGRQMISLL
jgi:hypothetical protein